MSATIAALGVLHEAIAKELLTRIRDGEASAADISNAIKFLKDNGVEARADKNPGLQSLAAQFPIFDDDERTVQ